MIQTIVLHTIAAALILTSSPVAAAISGRATIIDGDTIAVEGTHERIRLYGIDTPEGKQTCRDAADNRFLCGSRAAAALSAILGSNGRITCNEMDRDHYGRIVAECETVRHVNINAAMVESGWALEYTRYSDGRYHAHEAAARAAHRGLWAGRFVPPWDWRRGERLRSGIAAPVVAMMPLISKVAARRSCKAAVSCEDAVKMWCDGYSRADADGDGIPCENVCRTKAQVDKIKPKVGCSAD